MTTTALTITVAVLTALIIALGIWVYLLRREVITMRVDSGTARSVADALRDGRDEEAVRELLDYLEGAHGRIEALSKHARELDATLQRFSERSKGHLQRTGVVRFDASDSVSGGLSCALCVLDAHRHGFLVTSLYDLERSRTFVRAIRNGEADRELLPEEADALEQAMAAKASSRPTRRSPGAEEHPEAPDDTEGSEDA